MESESNYRPDIVITVELDVAAPITLPAHNGRFLVTPGKDSFVLDHLPRPTFVANHTEFWNLESRLLKLIDPFRFRVKASAELRVGYKEVKTNGFLSSSEGHLVWAFLKKLKKSKMIFTGPK